jgi:hypothetical protein
VPYAFILRRFAYFDCFFFWFIADAHATLIVCIECSKVVSSYSVHRVRSSLAPTFYVRTDDGAASLSSPLNARLGFEIARKCFKLVRYNIYVNRLSVDHFK